MQISRQLLITCAVAACLTPTFTHAYDNEAQIRARQALDEQMKQAPAQTPPVTSAPPAAPVMSAPATSKADDDKLTEALRQKMQEVPAAPTNAAIVVTKPAPKPAKVKVTPVPAPAPAPAPVMSAPPISSPADDKLAEALRQKMSEVPAEPVTPVVVTKPEPKPTKVKVVKTPTPPPQPQSSVVTVTTQTTTVENPPAQATPTFAPEISQPATPATPTPIVTSQSFPAPTVSNPADARLSDALHQKMHEETEPIMTPVPPPQKVVKPAPPIVVKTAPPQPQKQVVVTPAPTPAPAPVVAPAPAYAPVPDTSHTVTSLPETPMTTPMPTVNNGPAPAPTMSLPALSGPPSPLSATKQQKLDSLLEQYRMDQLTPQQYHEQRAKILSEP